jgi:hypothetical protein
MADSKIIENYNPVGRIVDYKVIISKNTLCDYVNEALGDFESKIHELIRQGYEPLGSAQNITSSYWCILTQTMIKREPYKESQSLSR